MSCAPNCISDLDGLLYIPKMSLLGTDTNKGSPRIEDASSQLPRVALPFTFEAQTNNQSSYAITLLQKIDNLALNKLDFEPLTTDSELHRIINVQHDLHEILVSLSTNYLFIKLQRQLTDKDQQFGILYHIQETYYGVIKLQVGTKLRDIIADHGHPIPNITSINDLTRLLMPATHKEPPIEFSMAPPSELSPEICSASTHQSPKANDPLTFLYSRYFSTLYSLTTPLNYFPKTALTRFKIMCENEASMSTNLERLFIPVEEMDIRHLGKHGILKAFSDDNETYGNRNLPREKVELEFQGEFLAKNNALLARIKANQSKGKDKISIADDEKLQKFVLELKLREAQLQVLIILELLCSWKISELDFLSVNLKQQEKELKRKNKETKPSLVRKKKSKPKKIIPTFLGMGVNIAEPTTKAPRATSVDQYAVYTSLNTILDRITLWDTLLGKNDNSYNFLAYVLVPFYNKKLPIIIKYMVDKIKEVNMKLTGKSEPRQSSKSDSESGNAPPKRSKYNKVLLSGSKVPHLRKSASTSVKDDLLPSFVLKRSNSNLSARHLEKREVDMSMKVPKPRKPEKLQSFSEKLSNSFIFGNVKKQKSQVALPSLPQIEATPAKKRIIDIPKEPPTLSQIESTPLRKRPLDLSIVKTPDIKSNDVIVPSSEVKISVTEKLMSLKRSRPNLTVLSNDAVFSSPIKEQERYYQQTPKETVISSPEKSLRRIKPGEPISVAESPFYNPHMGSPTLRRAPDQDTDEDSDYEMLKGFNKPKPKVYSRNNTR